MKSMTKRHIRTLAAFMAFALIGLMSVQVYWIDSAIHVKEERFKQDVHEAMVSVARTLEEAEYASAIVGNITALRKSAGNNHSSEQVISLQSNTFDSTPFSINNIAASVTASAVPKKLQAAHANSVGHLRRLQQATQAETNELSDDKQPAELTLRFIDSTGGIKILGDVDNLDELLRDSGLRLHLNELGLEKNDIAKGLQKLEQERARRKTERRPLLRRKKGDSTSASRSRRQVPAFSANTAVFSYNESDASVISTSQKNRIFRTAGYSSIHVNSAYGGINQPVTMGAANAYQLLPVPPTAPVQQHNVILRNLNDNSHAPVVVVHGKDAVFYRDSLVEELKRNKNALVHKIMMRIGESDELQAEREENGAQFRTVAFNSSAPASSEIESEFWTRAEYPDCEAGTPKNITETEVFRPKHNKRKEAAVAQKVEAKVEQLSDVAAKMVCELDAPRAFRERVAPRKLDSLVQTAFANKGIATDYEYAVMLENTDSVIYSCVKSPKVPLLKSGFSTALFPNDIVPKHFSLKVFFPQERSYILESLWAMLASSGIFIAAIIGTFVFTLNSLWNQKRLSDMKTDFINNMTHEFQTPIATISLAAEALKGGTSVGEEKRARFLDIIFNENKRLGKHVEQILHAAAYDDGRFTVHSTEVNINHTVMMAVQNIAMQVENRGGNIFCKFDVTQPVIRADHEHLANIIRNLLDNACKYSPDSPDITVTTQSNEKGVVITVADKGIGMTKEQQKRIFEKFYRVPTGNRHDVKGFGLGLSYVKTMAEAHGGSVSVESNAGSGSKFGIFLPYSI